MKNSLDHRIKKLVSYLAGFFPRPLPIGRHQFDKLCDNLFYTYGFPDLLSYRRTIATMIMHHTNESHMASPYSFARAIKKAQANEIAFAMLQELKEKELKEMEEIKQVVAEAT